MFISSIKRRFRYIINREPHLKYFLLTCFISSSFVFFLIFIQSRRKNLFEDDIFHITAIDHKGEHDSFGVLVPASSDSHKKRPKVANLFAYVTLILSRFRFASNSSCDIFVKKIKDQFPYCGDDDAWCFYKIQA